MLEAKPIFDFSNFSRQWQMGPSQLWLDGKQAILITGIGPIFTAAACGRLLSNPIPKWINLGVAAGLNENTADASIHTVKLVQMEGLQIPGSVKNESIKIHSSGVRLLSRSSALHDQELRNKLGQHHDLVDMEGYSIALLAREAGVQLNMAKIVSDFGDRPDSKTIIQRIPSLMQQLFSNLPF